MANTFPSYLHAFKTGLLSQRVKHAWDQLGECRLCPRNCGVNRPKDETGFCRTGSKAVVCSFNAHFGEESPLVGEHGSGTIFFTHCNMLCCFCQNYKISHGGEGREVTSDQLAWIMLELQRMGCHNINVVSPSHVVAQILAALVMAVDQGLRIPLVYNTGGYDKVDTLKLLDGIVDIYMPDIKFLDTEVAEKTCKASDYPEIVRAALKEMHRQVGDLILDDRGVATRGLLVRHLVMPMGMAGTREVMRFISQEISPQTYVNIMPQYRPCGEAATVPGLDRHITAEEFNAALKAAGQEGITRLDSRRRVFYVPLTFD